MDDTTCRVHKLVADVCLVAEKRVLLVRYKDTRKYDGQAGWFLPDDYLAHVEHPDDAARRILLEQVQMNTTPLALSYIESFDGGAWHLIFHYRGQLEQAAELRPAENVREAKWFALDALPNPDSVAHHGWALEVIDKVIGGES